MPKLKIWTIFISFLIVVVVIVQAKQIGKGSMCMGTGIQGCDNELTNLHCYEGRCRCPEALIMHSANLPTNLNTHWDESLHKCFATIGSMCDLHRTKKRVECYPGIKCHPDPQNPAAGTCKGSTFTLATALNFIIFILPLIIV